MTLLLDTNLFTRTKKRKKNREIVPMILMNIQRIITFFYVNHKGGFMNEKSLSVHCNNIIIQKTSQQVYHSLTHIYVRCLFLNINIKNIEKINQNHPLYVNRTLARKPVLAMRKWCSNALFHSLSFYALFMNVLFDENLNLFFFFILIFHAPSLLKISYSLKCSSFHFDAVITKSKTCWAQFLKEMK